MPRLMKERSKKLTMSITSEISRINNNISDAYDALEAKGATMPQVQNSANLADTIATISVDLDIEDVAALFENVLIKGGNSV